MADLTDLRWSVIGHLQTNKAKLVALRGRVPGAGQPARGRGVDRRHCRPRGRAGCVCADQYLGRGQQVRPAARRGRGLPAADAGLFGLRVRGFMTLALFSAEAERVPPVFRAAAHAARPAAPGRARRRRAGRVVDGHVGRLRDRHRGRRHRGARGARPSSARATRRIPITGRPGTAPRLPEKDALSRGRQDLRISASLDVAQAGLTTLAGIASAETAMFTRPVIALALVLSAACATAQTESKPARNAIASIGSARSTRPRWSSIPTRACSTGARRRGWRRGWPRCSRRAPSGARRPSTVISFEPLLIKAAGEDVTPCRALQPGHARHLPQRNPATSCWNWPIS